MRRFARVITALLISMAMVVLLVLATQAQSPTPPPSQSQQGPTGEEFTSSIPKGTETEWGTFVGVGHKIRYPTGWEVRPYWTQGSIRGSTMSQFLKTDQHGLGASIESTEIISVTVGAAVMGTDLDYWRQQADRLGYHIEAITVQGHPGWWIYAVGPQRAMGLWGTVWVDWGNRVYHFKLFCAFEACQDGEQRLRQMLSTLQIENVDWKRRPVPPSALQGETTSTDFLIIPSSPLTVTYDRDKAKRYADIYGGIQANGDGCYIWAITTGVACSKIDDRYWPADGAHFVNQAVYTGGRPIPGLWNNAAVRVGDLRNWLQGDGWGIVPVNQAQVGDVAIMGPFADPCQAALVVEVESGGVLTLAMHSDEVRDNADDLWCWYNGEHNYEKTYLHAPTVTPTLYVYLPLVMRNWPLPPPQPKKQETGMHLGSRNTSDEPVDIGWTAEMLQPIDGGKGGVWPTSIVVLSNQIYNLGRREAPSPPDDPYCKVINVITFTKSYTAYDYMKRASLAGVKVLIRVNPSPGNFEDWNDPFQRNHHLIVAEVPAGEGYCIHENIKLFRDVADIAQEIEQIHNFNSRDGWQEYAFVPVNEPNREWYPNSSTISPTVRNPVAWREMDAYFTALYNKVQNIQLPPGEIVRLLTPPMAQERFAEGIDILGTPNKCSVTETVRLIDGTTGYGNMTTTYQMANDGIAWHNYWRYGYEEWGGCKGYGDHLSSMVDPIWLRDKMRLNSRGNQNFVVEADLASSPWQMKNSNPLKDKNANITNTAQSLQAFFGAEPGALVNAWLLNYEDAPGKFDAEIHWHEAYSSTTKFRPWFFPWWTGSAK